MAKITFDERKIFLPFIITIVESYKTLFEKANDIIIWLVGFAITASGIFAFTAPTKHLLFFSFLFYAKALFMITIMCGIGYRILYSWLSMVEKKINSYMQQVKENIVNTTIIDPENLFLNYLYGNDL